MIKILLLIFIFFRSICLKADIYDPIYENAFDIAAGGASLTRSTQVGMLISNPAQLPVAEKLFRWLGMNTTFKLGKGSIGLRNDLITKTGNVLSVPQEGEEQEDKNTRNSQFLKIIHIQQVYTQDLYF